MGHRLAFAAGLSVAVTAVALFVSLGSTQHAVAQSAPPSPPTTYYGVASGGTSGGVVVAYVVDGDKTTKCGIGVTLLDQGKTVYVINVVPDGQIEGCGKAGREVKLTFQGPAERVPRPGTTTAAWVPLGPGYNGAEFNVVVGAAPPLVRQAAVPFIAKGP